MFENQLGDENHEDNSNYIFHGSCKTASFSLRNSPFRPLI